MGLRALAGNEGECLVAIRIETGADRTRRPGEAGGLEVCKQGDDRLAPRPRAANDDIADPAHGGTPTAGEYLVRFFTHTDIIASNTAHPSQLSRRENAWVAR